MTDLSSRPAASTLPGPDDARQPAGGSLLQTLRWTWRTLTSMRTALVLLLLLALAAVPGSLLPQRGTSPGDVARFTRENPTLAPVLERLSLFEVYSAPWFAAVYLLLLIAMTGCVVPRCRRLWVASRAQPGPAPARLDRFERVEATIGSYAVPASLLSAAADQLRRRRYRVRVDPGAGGGSVSAETGFAREVGNLVFHASLLVLLYGVAVGHLYGFEGRVIVVEGAGFSNVRAQYDEFTGGPQVDTGALEPFSFTLQDFRATFEQDGPNRGAARSFEADLVVERDGRVRPVTVRVNHPLEINGTKAFLTGHGYAPRFTVRDGAGAVAFQGPVVFLPEDGAFTSTGVIKVPDAAPAQLAFEGFFLPSAAIGEQGPISTFPAADRPFTLLTAWTGDLGLGRGAPQSVYTLDKSGLRQINVDGAPLAKALAVGDTMELPDGAGSITFDGVSQFANFQLAHDPGRRISLLAAVLLLLGLTTSLLVRQRRVFVRLEPRDGSGLLLVVAGSPRTRRGLPEGELAELTDAVLNRPVAPRSSDADRTTQPTPGRDHD